jgi:hypothetical protein
LARPLRSNAIHPGQRRRVALLYSKYTPPRRLLAPAGLLDGILE